MIESVPLYFSSSSPIVWLCHALDHTDLSAFPNPSIVLSYEAPSGHFPSPGTVIQIHLKI